MGTDQSESQILVTWYKWTNQHAARGHMTGKSNISLPGNPHPPEIVTS